MINTAQLLKNIIPIDVLMEMPLPFVHRLRDLRIEQLEAQRKENEKDPSSISMDTLAEALEDGM